MAPSDPNIVYVGSGEGLQRPDLSVGDGMYKSTDAGKTWRHLGLRDGQQIPAILVDPRNPNRLFVAVLGHPYGPNAERGVFRSTDGGQTFEKVLYKDEHTGAIDLAFDPRNPQTVYAVLWQARQGPWENGAFSGPNSGLFKSTDGGTTWNPLTSGLPTFAQGLGRIGIGDRAQRSESHVRPGRSARRSRRRLPLRRCRRHAGSASTTSSASTAAAPISPASASIPRTRTWSTSPTRPPIAPPTAARPSPPSKARPAATTITPSGSIPTNPNIILLALDQGATISVNYGRTWSSWYNQPTAQFYHVITDNQFPYWVYGGQQESGSVGIASRGNDGADHLPRMASRGRRGVRLHRARSAQSQHHLRRRHGAGASTVTRYSRLTGEVEHVGPHGNYRYLRTAPLLFSPRRSARPLRRRRRWCSRPPTAAATGRPSAPTFRARSYELPASVAAYPDAARQQATRRGVVYSIAPSHLNVNVIWAGTDDGLIHVTRDGGKTWKDVTPPGMTPWSKVSQLDASHFDDADRLRRHQPPPPRRSEAAHLPHARWRRHLEGDRPRPARSGRSTRCAKTRCARDSCSPAPSWRSSSPSTTATIGSRCA